MTDGTASIFTRLYDMLRMTESPDEHEAARRLADAHKFVFSRDLSGDLVKGAIDFGDQLSAFGLLRLPFDSVAFIFPFEEDVGLPASNDVLLLWADGDDILARVYILLRSSWRPSGATFRIPAGAVRSVWAGRDEYVVRDRSPVKPLDPQGAEYTMKHIGGLTFMALGLINSDGIVQSRHPAPVQLNAARLKKGKSPMFAFRTLSIDPEALRLPGIVASGNKHASPALHWRRGHIRRLPNGGLTIIRPHLVGKAENGVIQKDYRVGPD